ncbi:hypothetical protein OAD66_05855 [Bacteroidia bacterium]|nr:hypothetical protein [Bacteroidia bacterium]MDB9882641.1 hypothetical protein [Bacteroidia bacterium]
MKLDRNEYLESRSLSPKTLLLAILAVNVLLGIIVWVFPSNGVKLGDTGNLKFVSPNELLGTQDSTAVDVDLDEVLKGVLPDENIENIDKPDIVEQQVAIEANLKEKKDTLGLIVTSKAVPAYRSIQLPPNNPNALKSLLYAIKHESKNKVVRILHYGDSQLEGDRVTDYFRNKMQLTFGGKGTGMVLPKEPAASSRRAVFVSESKNIKKSAIYIKGTKAENNQYGIGGSAYTITGPHSSFLGWDTTVVTDSSGIRELTIPKFSKTKQAASFIKFNMGYSGHDLAKQHTRVTLIYQNDEHFQTTVKSDNFIKDYVLKPSVVGLGIKTWKISTEKKLKLSFTEGKFPKLYGVALDGEAGVAVDNFGMRGSSALGFDKMNRAFNTRQMKALNVRAIILQYGINVVPHVLSDYDYYRKILVKQLKSIKATNPGVSVIVIGPSDMSRNRGGRRVSYSNIPLIRNSMKEAAFETGCCFWDLYQAMGGENSMVAWVGKGLAQKDYTHFSYKGAKYVGEMLYDAIIEQLKKEE